jgi:methyltransferase (TIGR00027 family)
MGDADSPGVDRTAVWTAALRAAESARPDRLFDDRFAGAFVAAAGDGGSARAAQATVPAGASEFLAIRTRFFDDQTRAACDAGIGQVVLLAAGLDCRAFRLTWPAGVRLFELDLPGTLAFKESVLVTAGAVARCARAVVAADLRGPWADTLICAGFRPDTATGWFAEGLLPYLDRTDSDRLLSTVTELSAPGSRAGFDHIDTTAAERPAMRATSDAVRQMGARLVPTGASPADWLTGHGWAVTVSRVPALGAGYGRPLPAGVDLVASNATALIAAGR